jgi:hypothetical protein
VGAIKAWHDTPMRVAIWNLNHRVLPQTVPPLVTSAMMAALADVRVLKEYAMGKEVPRVAEYLYFCSYV